MDDYDYGEGSLEDYPWPEDIYDHNGQVDMDRLLEILESNPALMQQFQSMYSGGAMDYPDHTADTVQASDQTLTEVYNNCIQPNIISAANSLLPLLAVCLLCCFVSRVPNRHLKHFSLIALGCYITHRLFSFNSLILAPYAIIACFLLQYKPLWGVAGSLLSVLTLIFVVTCEMMIPAEQWHNIRGAQMVLSMKVISLGFDLANESVKDAPLLETLSYLTHPGSVIFGPWISFNYYIDGVGYKRSWLDWSYYFNIIKSLIMSVIFLTWSGCIGGYLIPADNWGKWPDAYRDAQSFRMSHYFVCSLAESTLLLSGVGVFSSDGELSSHVVVCQPINIEVPRSLVEVVTNWNIPMHRWLKNYVFKVAKPKYGVFAAILLTYISSSLLHGLNFQLAAVLLSLGFYSYVEHSLRYILAQALDLCVESRRCSQCSHRHGYLHAFTVGVNIAFTCLATYHLAYLGVMFDTSQPGEQEKGYSMWYTLTKWSNLGYSSHIVAACTFVFYWLVK